MKVHQLEDGVVTIRLDGALPEDKSCKFYVDTVCYIDICSYSYIYIATIQQCGLVS